MKKIITVGPNNQTGYRKHLEQLANLFPQSKYFIINNTDDSEVDELKKLNSDLIIFGGRRWIIRNKHILNSINAKKAILFCSPLAQAEISADEIANLNEYLKWLNQGLIDYLFVSSKNLETSLNKKNIIHLPAPILKKTCMKNTIKENDTSIFHDKTKHKNFLNTVTSAIISKAKTVQINGLTEEFRDFVNQIDTNGKIIDVGFLDKENYLDKLTKTKILVHLSFSESFCYTVAEAIQQGTLPLVSKSVDWITSNELIVESPVHIEPIVKKINYLLNLNDKEYEQILMQSQQDLEVIAKVHDNIITNTLKKILD